MNSSAHQSGTNMFAMRLYAINNFRFVGKGQEKKTFIPILLEEVSTQLLCSTTMIYSSPKYSTLRRTNSAPNFLKNACLIKIYERYATEDDEWYVAIVGSCTCKRAPETEREGERVFRNEIKWRI